MAEILYLVYELIHPVTGECFYVGKGNSRRSRFNDHLAEGRNLRLGKRVKNPIRAGIIASILNAGMQPGYRIVFNSAHEQDAFAEENRRIMQYGRRCDNTGTLANLTFGGEGVSGWRMSEEAKDKIRKSSTGRRHSLETRQLMAKQATGRSHSEETKAKISEAQKGIIRSEKHKEVLRTNWLGKKHSDDAKAKMRTARVARKSAPLTDEHKQKVSAAIKASWARRKEGK